MSPEIVERYMKAGRVIAKVRELARGFVKEEMPVIDLCRKVEVSIKERGCEPAFPCNVDIDEIAAHYTSPPRDPKIIPPGSIVKIDLGAHFDGYVADTAITISLNPEYEAMIQSVEEALEKAVELVKPGTKFNTIGSIVERTIKVYGYKPIRNLCGHITTRFQVHGPIGVPNVESPFVTNKFQSEKVYAIEPFATTLDAAGEVVSLPEVHIYHITKPKPPKDPSVRPLFETIKKRYWTLPFAKRWLTDAYSLKQIEKAFNSLLSKKIMQPYPVLIEKTLRPVAQAEHTVLLTRKEASVITI